MRATADAAMQPTKGRWHCEIRGPERRGRACVRPPHGPGRPTSSTTTPQGTRMSPTNDQLAYAVTQDDTVLCADCVTEVCDDRRPSEATTVHAWLAAGCGHTAPCVAPVRPDRLGPYTPPLGW